MTGSRAPFTSTQLAVSIALDPTSAIALFKVVPPSPSWTLVGEEQERTESMFVAPKGFSSAGSCASHRLVRVPMGPSWFSFALPLIRAESYLRGRMTARIKGSANQFQKQHGPAPSTGCSSGGWDQLASSAGPPSGTIEPCWWAGAAKRRWSHPTSCPDSKRHWPWMR